jgi:hypothetical protein
MFCWCWGLPRCEWKERRVRGLRFIDREAVSDLDWMGCARRLKRVFPSICHRYLSKLLNPTQERMSETNLNGSCLSLRGPVRGR